MYTLNTFVIIAIVVSLLSFLFAAWLFSWVKKRPSKNTRIAEVSALIRGGSYTFLRKEYVALIKFAGIVAIYTCTPY